MEFIKDPYRHCKTILALGAGQELLEMAGIGPTVEQAEGILVADGAGAAGIASDLINAVAGHRPPSGDRDPQAR